MVNFVKVNNVEEATHWIPLYDPKFIGTYHTKKIAIAYREVMTKVFGKEFTGDNHITYNKPYKLYFSENDEPMIIDDKGQKINLWLLHEGYYVKETNT